MITALLNHVRRRLAAFRTYRRRLAEIDRMTRRDFAELRTFGSDLREQARQQRSVR